MCTLLEAETKNRLQEHKDENDAVNTISDNWLLWCRLCAKEDPEENVSILLKGENGEELDDEVAIANTILQSSIEKYFSVQITYDDKLPKILCTECLSLITSLINFSERVDKVQQMLLTLNEHSESSETVDINSIRLEFGLFDDDRENMFLDQTESEIHYLDTNNDGNESETNQLNRVRPLKQPLVNVKIKERNTPEDLDDDNDEPEIQYLETNNEEDEYQSNKSYAAIEDSQRFIKRRRKEENGSGDSDNDNEESEIQFLEMYNESDECESDKLNITNPIEQPSIKKKRREENESGDLDDENNESEIQCLDIGLDQRFVKIKEENVTEYIDYDNEDNGMNTLDESLIDVPSMSKKKPRRSKRNNKNGKPKSETSLTHSKKVPTQQQYKCSQCSRVCKWKRDYEVHLLTHLPDEQKNRFPCSHCGKKFITRFRVTQHIRLAHMDDRPFACDICEKTFKENRYLKRHLETHNPSKHICAECGLQLNSIQTLNRHLLVHSDVRKHKCDYCGRAFKCSKNLKHHLLLHTGLRLYSCNFCNRSYNNATACRTHKKNAHPKELAALEEKGGGDTYTLLPTLEDLKMYAKTSSNPEVVRSQLNRRVRYRLKKFPTLGKNDEAFETSINSGCEVQLNPNRVRYLFPKK